MASAVRLWIVILLTAVSLLADGARTIASAQATRDDGATEVEGAIQSPQVDLRLQQEPAKPEAPPEPSHTGFGSLFRSTAGDYVTFPKRTSTWVILGIGAGAAAIAYPFDDDVNDSLQDADALRNVFKPGKYLGYAWVQGGAAVGLYIAGR